MNKTWLSHLWNASNLCTELNVSILFCFLHVDVYPLQIDDSDGKIVDYESSCDVLNVAL